MYTIQSAVMERIGRYTSPSANMAREAAESVFGVGGRLERRKAELEADRNLSQAGREAKLAEFVKGALAKDLAGASRPIRKALNHSKTAREGFKFVPPDRTDPVAEMRRAEIRSFILSQPLEKRPGLVMGDPGMMEAVLDAAPALSGFAEATLPFEYQRISEEYVTLKHGAKMKEVEKGEAVFIEAKTAVDVTRLQLQKASGLPPQEFENMMTTIETAAG